jgi:hypothetical protein
MSDTHKNQFETTASRFFGLGFKTNLGIFLVFVVFCMITGIFPVSSIAAQEKPKSVSFFQATPSAGLASGDNLQSKNLKQEIIQQRAHYKPTVVEHQGLLSTKVTKTGLCIENLYTAGCQQIDGLTAWNLANIHIPEILCEGDPEWYHDLTDSVHHVARQYEYTLTVVSGFFSTYFDVWVDFNDDLEYTDDEIVVDDAYCDEWRTPYEFTFFLPEDAPLGEHYMRFRTDLAIPVDDPCESLSYGNCADFRINITEAITTDAGVVSIDINNIVEPGTITPKVTVKNFGTQAQTFNVTITNNNGYTSTKTVNGLAPYASLQVDFDDWTAEVGLYDFEACTQLPGDEVTENDCFSKTVSVQESKTVFAYAAVDITGNFPYPLGWVEFDLLYPDNMNSLIPVEDGDFIAGAVSMPGGFVYGITYGAKLYEIDPLTGDNNYITTFNMQFVSGISYDGDNLYASTVTNLYIIDPVSGSTTPVGAFNTPGQLMISIDFNAEGELFGFDMGDDTFYSINKTTGEATAIGPLGFDFNYAQDMSIDRDANVCFIAGYLNNTTPSGLYVVDFETGQATLYAPFPGSPEITGFAIPYLSGLPENDLAVIGIPEPQTAPYLGEEEYITVRINNLSQNPHSNFEISYSISGGEPITETYTETIPPNTRVNFTFATPADLSVSDSTYIITVCTLLEGDENPDNDCADKFVTNIPSPLPPPDTLSGESFNNKVFIYWSVPPSSYDIFSDDFEGYENGAYVAENSNVWTTWTGQSGSAEDATASQDYAFSPIQSMKLQQSNDMVYPAENVNLGKHLIDYRMLIPEENSGSLILMQHFEPNVYEWGAQVYFKTDGTGEIDGGGQAVASFTFDHDTWLNVSSFINLDDDLAEIWLNNEMVHSWQWSTGVWGTGNNNQFGAVDYYQPADAVFYVDDFSHKLTFPEQLTGYNIYRDDEFLAFTTDTLFVDENPTAAQHLYCVESVYDTITSEKVCVLVDIIVGINQEHANELIIYPNPARDYLYINSREIITGVKIRNMLGNTVLQHKELQIDNITIDLKRLNPGVYLIQIETRNSRHVIKFLVR